MECKRPDVKFLAGRMQRDKTGEVELARDELDELKREVEKLGFDSCGLFHGLAKLPAPLDTLLTIRTVCRLTVDFREYVDGFANRRVHLLFVASSIISALWVSMAMSAVGDV
jgi:hypothetical protein